MARVREQQGCCARAHRDVLTASLGTLAQWPSSPCYLSLYLSLHSNRTMAKAFEGTPLLHKKCQQLSDFIINNQTSLTVIKLYYDPHWVLLGMQADSTVAQAKAAPNCTKSEILAPRYFAMQLSPSECRRFLRPRLPR